MQKIILQMVLRPTAAQRGRAAFPTRLVLTAAPGAVSSSCAPTVLCSTAIVVAFIAGVVSWSFWPICLDIAMP